MNLQVCVSEDSLHDAGYVQTGKFEHVAISFNMLSKMLGVSTTTLISYANMGLIPTTEENKVKLSDALRINFNELHDRYIKSRGLIIKRKRK